MKLRPSAVIYAGTAQSLTLTLANCCNPTTSFAPSNMKHLINTTSTTKKKDLLCKLAPRGH